MAQQRLDDANDRLLEMTERVRELQADMTRSDLRLTELKGQRKRKAVFESRIAIIDGEIEKMTVELRLAKQKVEDMHIVSPIDGVLNRVHVNPGTYVEDGQPLMLLHDPADLWIEAKVEESNIRLVEVGQPVRIELDAYPFEEFTGTVRAIGRVTLGQQSGLGAPDSGNGVQRIRVDIELPAKCPRLAEHACRSQHSGSARAVNLTRWVGGQFYDHRHLCDADPTGIFIHLSAGDARVGRPDGQILASLAAG